MTGPIVSGHDPRFAPVLLVNPGQGDLKHYLSRGGYQGAKKALTTMTPDEVINLVKAANLRGRGGAGFPTGLKWSFMPKDDGRQHYLVCNADESEPGSFKDRFIMEDNPHELIEGMIIGGYAIGATKGYIYIRGEYRKAYDSLKQGIAEAKAEGYLGPNLFGGEFSFEIFLHRGAGAYICGEETALMNSLEGLRANPRLKPPFPAGAGLWGQPTTINNVETLACVPHVVAQGAEWFNSIGTEKSKGPKLYEVSGPAVHPGVYELPIGTTLRELIFDWAGGVSEPVKALIPGGSTAPPLPFTDDVLDTPMDFEALAEKGSLLGTGGVILIPDSVSMVDAMWNITRFYGHESCGKCTPCREGVAGWMVNLFKKIATGNGSPGDVELLLDIMDNIEGRAFCLLADAAVWPVKGSLKFFRSEYDDLIERKAAVPGYSGRWK